MTPYNRNTTLSTKLADASESAHLDVETAEEAAAALREVEVESVRSKDATANFDSLDAASVNELRALAAVLNVANLRRIIDRGELIAAISERRQG